MFHRLIVVMNVFIATLWSLWAVYCLLSYVMQNQFILYSSSSVCSPTGGKDDVWTGAVQQLHDELPQTLLHHISWRCKFPCLSLLHFSFLFFSFWFIDHLYLFMEEPPPQVLLLTLSCCFSWLSYLTVESCWFPQDTFPRDFRLFSQCKYILSLVLWNKFLTCFTRCDCIPSIKQRAPVYHIENMTHLQSRHKFCSEETTWFSLMNQSKSSCFILLIKNWILSYKATFILHLKHFLW